MNPHSLPRSAGQAALLLAAVLAPALHAQAPNAPDALAARIDSVARGVLAATGVPSASVAVVRDGRLAYAQAYGNARLDSARAATPEMRYAFGSISKQFTAAALLLLQEDGVLSLDDPVEKWVPGLTRGRDITLRMLLSHTAGYQDYWPQDYVPPYMVHPTAPASIVARWGRQPLDFDPGTQWQYSNTNFVIAALAVEQAARMPFFQFVQERIFQKLGMTTATDFDARGAGVIDTYGYIRYALGPLRPALPTGTGWLFGTGGLAMTASDLAKWDVAMLHQALLSPASWRQMQTEARLRGDDSTHTHYGLGVTVGTLGGHRYVEHAGEVAGFMAENVVLPDDGAAVVVLTNQDAAPAANAIAKGIVAALFGAPPAVDSTAQARRIFEGLRKGTIDRSLFSANGNVYFNEPALRDFAASLGPLGTVQSFEQTSTYLRGGMTVRNYRVAMSCGPVLHAWTLETSDHKLEQFHVSLQ